MSILHDRRGHGPPVWVFSGQNYQEALRLPPGADIIVRNLQYSGILEDFRALFFDRVVLNYDRHIDWRTPGGIIDTRGGFDMEWLGDSEYDSKQVYPLEGKERVSLGKWCTQTAHLPE